MRALATLLTWARRHAMPRLAWMVLVPLAAMLMPASATAARLALVIGNDQYTHVQRLENASADAELMAASLRKAGYTVSLHRNLELRAFKDRVREFRARISGGDDVVFYYAGHGVQIGAMNYLLPVDVRSDAEDQVRDDALALSRVMEDLREQRPRFTLAVIDACRDNPFKGAGRSIGGTRGLTGVGGADGQMVIYSAGEGQQALDRLGPNDPVRNGVFTRVFAKQMETPGVPVDRVLKQVRAEVNALARSVGHTQVPAIYDQVVGDYYFYPPTGTAASAPPVIPPLASVATAPLTPPAAVPASPAVAPAVVAALGSGGAPRVRLGTSMGDIVIELYPDKAPRSVQNFLQYVREGHYEGTTFHRVIEGFMIQGGGYLNGMVQKATRAPIPLEASNGLRNDRGTVAMARTSNPDSATAQFFINVVDNAFLNAKGPSDGYAVFGRVVSGMDVVDRIRSVPTSAQGSFRDVPVTPVTIRQATLEP